MSQKPDYRAEACRLVDDSEFADATWENLERGQPDRLHNLLTEILEAAHAAGERRGLERAAEVAEACAQRWAAQDDTPYAVSDAASIVRAAIRALSTPEPAPLLCVKCGEVPPIPEGPCPRCYIVDGKVFCPKCSPVVKVAEPAPGKAGKEGG